MCLPGMRRVSPQATVAVKARDALDYFGADVLV